MAETNQFEICPHCFTCRQDITGPTCTYGLPHEFPAKIERPKQAKKVDAGLCTKCGLHSRNPASAVSACAHEYHVA
jgi:hypothetical protein